MKKAFLILLVIVCIAVVVWTAYLLSTNQTDPVMGGIILVVDIGVLIWNISVLRAYRIGGGTVIAAFLIVALIAMTVSAFAGIEPFAGLKEEAINHFSGVTAGYDVEISPGQSKAVDDWLFSLNGGGWKGGNLTVKITITNLSSRRIFDAADLLGGIRFAAIDSTDKVVEPTLPGGESLYFVVYEKEFYPNESWTGTLIFEMSPYSGRTGLYITRWQFTERHCLFDLGEPATPESKSMTSPSSLQSGIIGKWRHGVPEQCPPTLDPRLYEELKQLPEGKTYFLKFTNSGQVSYSDNESGILNGTYRFVADAYVEINWASGSVPTAQPFSSQHGIYEIQISEEMMYLRSEQEIEASYWRVS
jgi:hypothetical protein